MIEYTQQIDGLTEDMLDGFFVGWPNPPSKKAHMNILLSSYCVWIAVDKKNDKVVGFITAISDGIMCAYIPLLEVLPRYQGLGIGKGLVSRMIKTLSHLYMVDLLCDEDLVGFYKKLGMAGATGAFLRNYERQNCK